MNGQQRPTQCKANIIITRVPYLWFGQGQYGTTIGTLWRDKWIVLQQFIPLFMHLCDMWKVWPESSDHPGMPVSRAEGVCRVDLWGQQLAGVMQDDHLNLNTYWGLQKRLCFLNNNNLRMKIGTPTHTAVTLESVSVLPIILDIICINWLYHLY